MAEGSGCALLLSQLIAWNGLFVSVFTTIIGLIYIQQKGLKWKLEWSECGWENKGQYELWVDCNQNWTNSFGVVGMVFWFPLYIGLAGLYVQRAPLLKAPFPRKFAHYGAFLVFNASYANFAYCGRLGIVCGAWSMLTAGFCFLASFLGFDHCGRGAQPQSPRQTTDIDTSSSSV
eukprot:TRINITY_DN10071_c0_g1_i2.p2 TRINITY_DN10071_c0_g1~~TRINITY_DN10071_c0_g1_i2.p2  ORF type:complete len:175 (-),score=42.05 TRINITY_DN10071_c0_g1_i2:30-554(-)